MESLNQFAEANMEDIRKVIMGLKSCTRAEGRSCQGCPYFGDKNGCRGHVERDALEILQVAAAEK